MMTHLTPADYRTVPWANGRGQTVEMVKQTYVNGQLSYRLSVATVSENGPFSVYPNVNRSLTVIDGPGFDLIGQEKLRADPLKPISFSGDSRVVAANVFQSSQDFNVMVHKSRKMTVSIQRDGILSGYLGELLFYFALGPAKVGRWTLDTHDLLYGRPKQMVEGGPVIVVQID